MTNEQVRKLQLQKHYESNENFKKIGQKNFWVELASLAVQYNAVNLGEVYFKCNQKI